MGCGCMSCLRTPLPQAAQDADSSGTSTSDEELADAEEAVAEFSSSGRVSKKKPFASLLEVAGLIFLAEWGDRSMLATIALGAAQVRWCSKYQAHLLAALYNRYVFATPTAAWH